MLFHLPLVLSYLTLLTHLTYATSPTQLVPTIPPVAIGRDFSLSENAPMATILSRDPNAVQTITSLTRLFKTFEHAVHVPTPTPLPTSVRIRGEPEGKILPTCDNHGVRWRQASNAYVMKRGWRINHSLVCVTDVFGHGTSSIRRNAGDRTVRETFNAYRSVMNSHRQQLMLQTIGNWTDVHFSSAYPFRQGSLQCNIDSLSGFRIDGVWHILAQLTNHNITNWVPDGARRYVTEYLRPNTLETHKSAHPTHLVSARMRLPIRPLNGTRHEITNASTTVHSIWGGADLPSHFRDIDVEDNFAVREALSAGKLYEQQVEAATTISNIAIITLPLAMNLFPVAFIADLSFPNMILLAFLSDILSAMPMFIKGVELLVISSNEFLSVATRLGDSSSSSDITVVAEMWVVGCRIRQDIQPLGIVFVVVSVTFMFIGVALEIVSRRYVFRIRLSKELRDVARNTAVSSDNISCESCVVFGEFASDGGAGRFAKKISSEMEIDDIWSATDSSQESRQPSTRSVPSGKKRGFSQVWGAVNSPTT